MPLARPAPRLWAGTVNAVSSSAASARNAACGLPEDAGLRNSKVRTGESGAGRPALSAELAAEIDARWKEVVGRETGCTSYAELRRRGANNCGEES